MKVELENIYNNSTHIGCISYAIFEYQGNVQSDDIFFEYLAEIYRHKSPEAYNSKQHEWLHRIFGPFTIKNLKLEDFSCLELSEINNRIHQFIDKPDWGEDLEVFKSNWKLASDIIQTENFIDCKFYYINIDEPEKHHYKANHEAVEWFIYFIGMFAIDKENGRFMVIDLSLD
jgi:hypothetical protein